METIDYLLAKKLPVEVPDFASRMILPRKIWDFLAREEILQEHGRLKVINSKRKLSAWERYFISSSIPFPQTISEEAGLFSYIGILNTSASLLESIELYPEKIEDLWEVTRQRAQASIISYGRTVGADVSDSMIQPVTQMTLNSFKESGSGKNMAGGIAAAQAIIDLSAVANPSATIFFRDSSRYDDIIVIERLFFNTISLDTIIVHAVVEKFDDLQTDWYNIFKNSPLYKRQFQENPDTLRIYFDAELLIQNQIDILQVIFQQDPQLSIREIFVSPPLIWGDLMTGDTRLSADRRIIIVDIIAPPSQKITHLSANILETPGRILAVDYINNPKSDMRIISTAVIHNKIIRVFLHIDQYQEDARKIIRELSAINILRNNMHDAESFDLALVTENVSYILRKTDTPQTSDSHVFADYYLTPISSDIPITNPTIRNFIESVISVDRFWILDIYPNKFNVLRAFFDELLLKKVEEEVGSDISETVYLFNKLLPKLRNLTLGGRDEIKEIFPKKFLLQNFIMDSKLVGDGLWNVIFQERLMREYLLDTTELAKRLRDNNLLISGDFIRTIDDNWQVLINSERNPLEVIRAQPIYNILIQSQQETSMINSWWLKFAEEDKEVAANELRRLGYNINEERRDEEDQGKNIMYLVDSVVDPQIVLRNISDSAQIVYAETDGGNLWQILADERLNPYGCYINDANVIREVLGIEAARNFILHSLVDIMSQKGSLDIDSRHLLLFIDLVTRTGFLAKSHSLGKHEPASILERASLRSPIDAFAAGVVEKSGKLGPLASVMMGFIPHYGAAANPRLIGREPQVANIGDEDILVDIPQDILDMQIIESDQKLEGDIKEIALENIPTQALISRQTAPIAATLIPQPVSTNIAPISNLVAPIIIPK